MCDITMVHPVISWHVSACMGKHEVVGRSVAVAF